MTERQRAFIRTISALAGDIAVGLLFASVCVWIINIAALGIFLSFLMWMLGAFLAMAVSQYLIHPTVNFLLSDRKLEETLRRAYGLTDLFMQVGSKAADSLVQKAASAAASHFTPWIRRWI